MWLSFSESDIKLVKAALAKKGDKYSRVISDRIDEQIKRLKDLQPYCEAAMEHYQEESLEIDDDAVVSKGDDDGAYVMAWTWVRDSELKTTKRARRLATKK